MRDVWQQHNEQTSVCSIKDILTDAANKHFQILYLFISYLCACAASPDFRR